VNVLLIFAKLCNCFFNHYSFVQGDKDNHVKNEGEGNAKETRSKFEENLEEDGVEIISREVRHL